MSFPSPHHHPHHHHGHVPRPSHLFDLWAAADQHVPFPFLLFWAARPPPKTVAATLRHLTHVDFVYGTTTDFIVAIGCRNGAFTPAIVERGPRRSGEFRYMPIMGRTDLRLNPEQAEDRIESYLLRQDLRFWEFVFEETGRDLDKVLKLEIELLCRRYREHPWHSVRLERPRGAGLTEPIYKFQKARCRCEIWVGAQSGEVEHHYLPEDYAPPPSTHPLGPER
jgi:hypothetical protein